MPKKKQTEPPDEQSRRFTDEVQRMIDAGELSPTEADAALDGLVRRSAQRSDSPAIQEREDS